jgi:hypothetical protein
MVSELSRTPFESQTAAAILVPPKSSPRTMRMGGRDAPAEALEDALAGLQAMPRALIDTLSLDRPEG